MELNIVFCITLIYFTFTGPFTVKPLEEAGFVCPKLNFALRNPMKIADHAQKLIQEGAKNNLEGVLRCPIMMSTISENMIEGQLIHSESVHLCSKDALRASHLKIPFGKYALYFIDDTNIAYDGGESIKDAFSEGPMPLIFTGKEDTNELKNWLCDPKSRKSDMCIVGREHQCNGIETDIVVHIYVSDCPVCQISNADPVIISRAKSMVVLSTYERLECKCGWKKSSQIGWQRQNSNESTDESTNEINEGEADSDLQMLLNSNSPSYWEKMKHLKPRYQILIVMIGLVMLSAIITGIIAYCWPKRGKYSSSFIQ